MSKKSKHRRAGVAGSEASSSMADRTSHEAALLPTHRAPRNFVMAAGIAVACAGVGYGGYWWQARSDTLLRR